jgi:hypothetical protein
MTLAILQPTLIPDLHDLAVIMQSDTTLCQDSEQWSRKGRTHRAVIRTPEGTDYISVPLLTSDKKKPINRVRIDHSTDWIPQILRALEFNYRNSVYYDFYEPEIRADIEQGFQFEFLLDFSLFLRRRLFQFLEISSHSEIIFSSTLENYDQNPDLTAKNLGADRYFQEHDARHYQRQGQNRSEIRFNHPVYRQHFPGFEPYCCLYDLLFQYGPECFKIIDEIG